MFVLLEVTIKNEETLIDWKQSATLFRFSTLTFLGFFCFFFFFFIKHLSRQCPTRWRSTGGKPSVSGETCPLAWVVLSSAVKSFYFWSTSRGRWPLQAFNTAVNVLKRTWSSSGELLCRFRPSRGGAFHRGGWSLQRQSKRKKEKLERRKGAGHFLASSASSPSFSCRSRSRLISFSSWRYFRSMKRFWWAIWGKLSAAGRRQPGRGGAGVLLLCSSFHHSNLVLRRKHLSSSS